MNWLRHVNRDRTRDRHSVRSRDGHRDVSVDGDWYGLRDRDRDLLCYGVHLYVASHDTIKPGTSSEIGDTEISIAS
jgi:hypothetical protein